MKMIDQSFCRPVESIYRRLLLDCIRKKDLQAGRQARFLLLKSGLQSNLILGNLLVRLFCLCGCLTEATQAFEEIANPSPYSWGAIICGNIKYGQDEQGISLYHRMLQNHVTPYDYVYVAVLKACARTADLKNGRLIHAHIMESGYRSNVFIGNALVHMYAKCGSLADARLVFFDSSWEKDLVSWNVMIAAYIHLGLGKEALQLFKQMQSEGFQADSFSFVSALQACGSMGDLDEAKLLHALITTKNLQDNVYIGNALIDTFSKCGSPDRGRKIFDDLPRKNLTSWNLMLGAYVQHKNDDQALDIFQKMRNAGMKPDGITYVSVLKACNIDEGRLIHDHLIKMGTVLDGHVGNSVMEMYIRCENLEDARQVFDGIVKKNVVSWNTMISGYTKHGFGRSALDLFAKMQQEGMAPDAITFLSVLKACGNITAIAEGKAIHAQIIKSGIDSQLYIGNSLVDMYAKCGDFAAALHVLHKLPEKSVVPWNAVIAGCAQYGLGLQALQHFKSMQEDGICPNSSTFVSILKACTGVAAMAEGKLIHSQIIASGLESDVHIMNTVVDMYAKCGDIEKAREVFDKMPDRDIVSWNVLISAYAQHGRGKEALDLLENMKDSGVRPDSITFNGLLLACNHASLVDEGVHVFRVMSENFGIIPDTNHYSCIIDLLSRYGNLHEVEESIKARAREA